MSQTLVRIMTIAVALLCAPAAQGAGWVASGPLSPPDRVATEPQVIITPSGGRVIAWVQNLADGFTVENISVRVAPPGGDFGQIQTFVGRVDGPQLAVGPDGTVALAWVDFSAHTVHIARLTPGQASFVEATPLTVPGGETPSNLHLAFVGSDAVVSFDSFVQQGPSSIWAARLPAAGDALEIVPGTAAGGAIDHRSFASGQPEVFVDHSALAVDHGHAYVSWLQENEGQFNDNGFPISNGAATVRFATDALSGQFGAPAPLDTVQGTSVFAPRLSPRIAAGGGHVYVVWLRPSDNKPVNYEDVAAMGTRLSIPTDAFFRDPLVAADESGTLFVAGQSEPPGSNNEAVSVAIVPAGTATAPAPVRITPAGIGRQLDALAVASDGTAVLLPDRVSSSFNGTAQVLASLRSPGAGFATPQDVSGLQDVNREAFQNPAAAVASGGEALVLWGGADHTGGANERLHLSEFDALAPTLTALSVPATATVGQPVTMSAAAGDNLTTTSVSWDFGDGSQASGSSVSHVFDEPGAKTVTITAADAVGNSVTRTQVIAVAPATVPVDRTPPVVTGLSFSHARFRVAKHATAQIASARTRRQVNAPIGTSLRLTVSERATLVIRIRQRIGRRSAARGTLVRAGTGPGATTIAFSGRIGRDALAPGSYIAAISAIDGAGNVSAPHTLTFAVVR